MTAVKKASRASGWLLRAAASFFLLWLVVRKLDWSQLTALWASAHWGWIAAAFGLMLVNRVLSVSRVLWLLRANGTRFDLQEVGRIVLGSEFIGSFLPGNLGCDSIRIFGLARHTANAPMAGSVVFLERLVGVLALLFFVVLGAFLSWSNSLNHGLFWAAIIPSSLVVLFIFTMLLNEHWVDWLSHKVGFHGHRLHNVFQQWQQAVHAYSKKRSLLARVAAVSLVIQAFRVVSVYCVGRALSSGMHLADVLVYVPVILLMAMLPISIGGLGVRENAFVHCFRQVGVEPAVSFSVSLIAHALSVIANVPGGLWSFWLPAKPQGAGACPQTQRAG